MRRKTEIIVDSFLLRKRHFVLTFIFFTILLTLFLFWYEEGAAGDYHSGDTLMCQYCHTVHYSISQEIHDEGFLPRSLAPGGPFPKLLKNNVTDLCLSCHDNTLSGYPDVLGASRGTVIRQAGMLNMASSPSPYEHWKGHTLGSTSTAPGGTFSNAEGLTCIDCHMPHGDMTAQYRNLWVSANSAHRFYNKSITYATMTNDLSKDVFQKTPSPFSASSNCTDCHPMHGTDLRYDIRDISFNKPNSTRSAIGAWCGSCHNNFHGQGGDENMGGQSGGHVADPWLRHPTADVMIGANSNAHSSYPRWSGLASNKRVQAMSASGTYPATDNAPFCLSCHRGHGSVNPFGLIFTNPDGTLAIESAQPGASLGNTCQQCHNP